MGCCTSFSATTDTTRADPSRHVNFTTGMVLGVDDYRQEFAYHSGRDAWHTRALHGYGTIAGLDVILEADGEDGPRIRVTPGSAAAPSGQMICVGREQCGSVNQWLQRPETTERLTSLAANPLPANEARLSLWLTLCYRDCAVAPVPVPGEPCRSDEELMAPSRIADDYSLSFSFTPPAMAEAEGIARFAAWLETLEITDEADSDASVLDELLDVASQQLDLLIPGKEGPEIPDSLKRLSIHPDHAAQVQAHAERLWITRLRPRVMAIPCSGEAAQADDCILLARIDLRVIRESDLWQVANLDGGDAVDLTLDQSDRPLLFSTNVAHLSGGGTAMPGQVAFIDSDDTTTVSDGFIVIAAEDPVRVAIPASDASTRGSKLTIALARPAASTLETEGAGTIDRAEEFSLEDLREVQLVADGEGDWRVIHRIAFAGGD